MTRTLTRCRHAEPTLFLDWPHWLDAWTSPWTCEREGQLRLLSGDDACRNCPHWAPRPPATVQTELATERSAAETVVP